MAILTGLLRVVLLAVLLTAQVAGKRAPRGLPLSGPSISTRESERAELLRLRVECSQLRSVLVQAQCDADRVDNRLAKAISRVSGGGGGDHGGVHDYRETTILSLIVHRGGWLAVFLISLSLTSFVMNGFEHTLEKHIELALFVPLLIGHGGNAGGQTVGTVLGAMTAEQVCLGDWAKVMVKECLAGLGAGSLTDIALLPLLAVMKISNHVSAAILVTLPVLTVLASALGAGLPFLVSAVGADPAVIAAPAMTTLVDVGGLIAYFLIAKVVFAMFGLEM